MDLDSATQLNVRGEQALVLTFPYLSRLQIINPRSFLKHFLQDVSVKFHCLIAWLMYHLSYLCFGSFGVRGYSSSSAGQPSNLCKPLGPPLGVPLQHKTNKRMKKVKSLVPPSISLCTGALPRCLDLG